MHKINLSKMKWSVNEYNNWIANGYTSATIDLWTGNIEQ